MSESKEAPAYNHSGEIVGTGNEQAPEVEHRSPAGGGTDRNEITPDARNQAQPARTTHQDTKFTQKDGARDA